MNKETCYYKGTCFDIIIDLLLGISLIGMLFTAAIVKLIFPTGSRSCENLFWGLNGFWWRNTHWYIALAFFAILIVHVIYHWEWFACLVRNIWNCNKKTVKTAKKK